MPSGSAPTEIELKLSLSPRDLPRLLLRLARFGRSRTQTVDNVYYDTSDRQLARSGLALRLRRIGRRRLQTLKAESGAAAAALSKRGEWEVPAPDGKLDPGRFPSTPLTKLLEKKPRPRLLPVFRTRFSRRIWLTADGAIEIALDQGEIAAGKRTAPILELELEVKSGSAAALYPLALDLIGKGRHSPLLLPAVESKAARGYRLASGAVPAPCKANARAILGDLAAKMTLAAAMRTLTDRATNLLLLNAAGHLKADDPEFVHQARVALRRLRSAARLIGKAAAWPEPFDAELRWIGRELGALRDSDVLLSQTIPALQAAVGDATALSAIADLVRKQRRRDERALRNALHSKRFAMLALQLLQWAHTEAPSSMSIAAAGGKRLARLHRRLIGEAAFFVALPTSRQHRVRILAKRLRYALDLFAVGLPAKAAAGYGRQLARVQDQLGALNDAVVAADKLQQLARRARVDVRQALEWLEGQRREHALQAESVLAALAQLHQPWR